MANEVTIVKTLEHILFKTESYDKGSAKQKNWSFGQGCQVQKNLKRPNLAISSYKKAKSSKMKKAK